MTATRRGRAPYRPDPQGLADSAVLDYPGGVTHRKVERLVDELAADRGWLVHAIHDSRGESWGASSGWPDRFFVRGNRAIALEIKVPPDAETPEQTAWLTALDTVPGITARVFRSSGRYTTDLTVLAGLLR